MATRTQWFSTDFDSETSKVYITKYFVRISFRENLMYANRTDYAVNRSCRFFWQCPTPVMFIVKIPWLNV